MGKVLRPDGGKIRTLRLRKGWAREQLSQIADVRPRTIRKVEAGGNASFETLRSIAGALGLEVHELMMGSLKPACRPGLFSADTYAPLLAWCLPYAPAAKGLMASFTLVLLAASAISLAPLLVERDEVYQVVDSAQTLSRISLPVRPSARPEPRLLAPKDSLIEPPRMIPAEKIPEAAVEKDLLVAVPAPAKPSAPGSVPGVEHARVVSAIQTGQTSGAVQTLAAAIQTHWLADMAQTELVSMELIRHVHTVTAPARPNGSLSESANRGPGGYSLLGRPFVKSGKGTAAFFTKVAGSIKRAF